METVTVSSNYQIAIPPRIREALQIQPGQKLHIMVYENRIVLIPVIPIQQLRGFLKGIDTTVDR